VSPGPAFAIELDVRDHECDLQGHVNNAVYLHYLEHARHLYLKTLSIDFAAWAERGVHLVVTRIEIDYRHPLTSGDRLRVTASMERVSRLRFAFMQEIERLPDGKPVVSARVVGTAIDRSGRPTLPEELDRLLAPPAAGAGALSRG
jgi:acyl-CoA thioester hydrolase